MAGYAGIVSLSVYSTPISFTIGILCFALSAFKLQFFNTTPIALQKIVDRISDGYIIVNEDNRIIDFNKTFITMLDIHSKIRNQDFYEFIKNSPRESIETFEIIKETFHQIKEKPNQTIVLDRFDKNLNKYFSVEISGIVSNRNFLGILILFKDTTEHMLDLQTISDNQETLMEKERLASLGQLIGGIAHNLKTPIMSISGAAEGLTDLIKEYETSIGDSEVTIEDHHEIAKDMATWIAKIKTHTEYMSDVITAVKGQAVTLSNEADISFTVGELLKRVNILMKHELKNAIVYLNIKMLTDENAIIHGDVNSLVQVINNMISNSIQAYNGKPEQNIDLIVEKENNDLMISIKDYGSGMPKHVKDKLFKEMITTKGKNGTGLGLYMSYSTIKAHFNGNITVESEEGLGTTFCIVLPL
ncbi:MAG: PAS domain-containing protein [Clostridia bacterium]|nr:PAS domain-containing protein [Clostridia bacterium]